MTSDAAVPRRVTAPDRTLTPDAMIARTLASLFARIGGACLHVAFALTRRDVQRANMARLTDITENR